MQKKHSVDKPILFRNSLPIQVRFNDVDIMGHVSNTVYQNYYDTGKLNYFDQVLPEMDFVTLGVVGASIKIDFFKPIFMKTRICVETRVSEVGNKSFTMEHQLVNEQTREVLSTCHAVLVCFNLTEQKSIPIPTEWRQKILDYDQGVLLK